MLKRISQLQAAALFAAVKAVEKFDGPRHCGAWTAFAAVKAVEKVHDWFGGTVRVAGLPP